MPEHLKTLAPHGFMELLYPHLLPSSEEDHTHLKFV